MTGYKFFNTVEIDLAEFGLQGTLEVRGMYQNLMDEIAKLGKGRDEDDPSLNVELTTLICKRCIVSAPFEVNDENIGQLPVAITAKVVNVANSMDKTVPLA